jgi:hypothetical protein
MTAKQTYPNHKAQPKDEVQSKGKARPKDKAGSEGEDQGADVGTADDQDNADEEPKPTIPPDRMSIDPGSRFFDEDGLSRGIGIRFKGKQRTNVQEYCISEGWVKMTIGKSVDRHGRPLTIKSTGPVEAWYEDLGDDAPVAKLSAA